MYNFIKKEKPDFCEKRTVLFNILVFLDFWPNKTVLSCLKLIVLKIENHDLENRRFLRILKDNSNENIFHD